MYRVIQFWHAVSAEIRPDELAHVRALLGPRGAALFARLSRSDQRHSLDVCQSLESQGVQDSVLLVAALLHDVGKTAGHLSLPYRVAVVLLHAFAPRLLEWAAARADFVLFRPFRVSGAHAELGARLVADAGFSNVIAELIRRHHEPAVDPSDPLADRLSALIRADGLN